MNREEVEAAIKEAERLRWPGDFRRAAEIQRYLSGCVRLEFPGIWPPRLVAGADCAYGGGRVVSAACLYELPGLTLIDESFVTREAVFPYVPGFLSFREGPAVIDAIRGLKYRPDLVIFDGQGIAHPRGLGIASYAGVALGLPSVGCAKTRLIGEYDEPGEEKGSVSPLRYHDRAVGAVVRTRAHVKPLFVSPGHLIDIGKAVEAVLLTTGRLRLPEPVRRADAASREAKKRRL